MKVAVRILSVLLLLGLLLHTTNAQLIQVAFTGDSEQITVDEAGTITDQFCAVIQSVPGGPGVPIGTPITLQFTFDTFAGMPAATFNNLGTSPDDFSFTPATTSVNFPNTAVQGNVQCITVAGIQDAIGEETETLLVNIADDTAVPPVFEVDGAVAGFSAFVQIDVTDDDSPQFNLVPGTAAPESPTPVQVCVVVSDTTTQQISIGISAASGSATSGIDFTGPTPATLVFPSGSSQPQCANFVFSPDNNLEGDEVFTVNLGTPTSGTVGPLSSSQVTIQDANQATVTLGATAVTVGEGMTNTVNLNLNLNGATLQTTIMVPVITAVGGGINPATSGVDFTAAIPSSPFSFTPGGLLTMPVTVDGLPDTLVEGDETYLVQIDTGGIVGPAIAGSPAVATVTILDEDSFVVNVDVGPSDENGLEGPLTTLNLCIIAIGTGTSLQNSVTATFTLTGKANILDLVAPFVPEVTLQASAALTACTGFRIEDDSLVEGTEQLTFTITSLSTTLGIGIGPINQFVHTITDNDGGGINDGFTFMDGVEDVVEDSSSIATFCLLLNLQAGQTLGCPVTVTMEIMNGNNANAGEDFTIPLDLDLNFPVGVGNGASDCLNIQILEDFDFEGDHSFFVDIMSISPPTVGLADIAGQAVVNIMDDDDATVTLQNNGIFSGMEGTNAMVCIRADLSSPTGEFEAPLTVQLGATPGTAGAADFTQLTSSVTFTAGSASGMELCFTFFLILDQNLEGPESFNVFISDFGGAQMGAVTSGTFTILDDDAVMVAFFAPSVTINEGNMGDVCVRLSTGAGGPNTLQNPLTVVLTVTNNGKAGPDDYTLNSPFEVVIPAGSIGTTSFDCETISTVEDFQVEGDHGFDVNISPTGLASRGVTIGTLGTTTVIIDDDDGAVTIQFMDLTPVVTEGAGNGVLQMCAEINLPPGTTLGCDIDVPFSANSGLRANDGDDFMLLAPTTVTFTDGAPRCVNVMITDDENYEGDHTFTMSLGPLTVSPTLATIVGGSASITIQDNNDAMPFVTDATLSVTEGPGGALRPVCVNSGIDNNGLIELPLSVTFSLTDGKATSVGPMPDFTIPILTVTFAVPPGGGPPTPFECINVPILDDTVLEGNHDFTATIINAGPFAPINPAQDTTVVTINDNEQGSVEFTAPSSMVDEGMTAMGCCVRISSTATALGCEVQVMLMTMNGKADQNDFTAGAQTITFPAGTAIAAAEDCASILTADDMILEGNHDFSVMISGSTPPNALTIGPQVDHMVTIIDDEPMATIALDGAAPLTCSEADVMVSFCVEISGLPAGGLGCDIMVEIVITPGTAVETEDYTIDSATTVTFNSGTTMNGDTACVNVGIEDDDNYEEDQMFSVSIGTLTPASAAMTGFPNTMTKTLQDNEDAVAAFTQPEFRGGEEAGDISVCIDSGVMGTFQATLTVTLMASSGKADVAEDTGLPDPPTVDVVFPVDPATPSVLCADIPITSDDFLEDDHDFMMTIVSAGNAPHATISTTADSTTVVIEDDENGLVTLAPIADVEEGQDLNVCVDLICTGSTLGCELLVDLSVADDPPKTVAGEDFAVGPYVVSFAIGTALPATSCTTIMTIDDDNVEGDQDLQVSIDDVNLPVNVALLQPTQQTATLIDNDEVTVGFSQPVYQFMGGMGAVELMLVVSGLGAGILECDVDVSIIYTDGPKAISGMDYEPGLTTFTLPMTTTMDGDVIPVPLTILSDEAVEGLHSFSVEVEDSALVEPGQDATIEIMDNDMAAVQMAAAVFETAEGAGPVSVCVELTSLPAGGLECEIEVTISITPGTKTAEGEDYMGTSVDVLFPITSEMGDTECADISILDDDALECEQDFNVAISSATLGTEFAGPLSQAVVTIEDNDSGGVVLDFTEDTFDVNEGDGNVLVCMELIGLPADGLECDLVIPLIMVPGKARPVDDYVPDLALSIIFEAANFQAMECATIGIEDDDDIECEHSFTVEAGNIDCDTVPAIAPVNPSAEVAIADNDDFTVEMSAPAITVDEGVGDATDFVCVNLDIAGPGMVECELTVTISPSDGTATAGGAVGKDDYVPGLYTITIPPDSLSGDYCTDLEDIIVDDAILEMTETFYIDLVSVTPCGVLGNDLKTEISITDNDKLEAGFTVTDFSVAEGDTQEICVELLGSTERPIGDIAVEVKEIIGDSADYSLMGVPLMFGAGADSDTCVTDEMICFNFTATQEDIKEAEEKFKLYLATNDTGVCFCSEQAHVSILEDDTDVVTVSLSVMNNGEVSEDNGAMLVLVSLVGQLQVDIYVTVETEDGTAVMGEDYRRVSHVLVFTPNTISPLRVYVPLLNDDCLEYDEYFFVVASTNMDCVNLDDDNVTIHILDDDVAKFSLDETLYRTSENEDYVLICVVLKSPIKRDVTLTLEFANVTAYEGSDYIAPDSRTATFTDGSVKGAYVCFNFTIVDDDCVEYSERFRVYLASDDPDVIFHFSSAYVYIADNDYALFGVQFDYYHVDEDDGPVHLCAELQRGCLERNVTVEYSTFDGTALNGTDYYGRTCELPFEAGSPVGTVSCVYIDIIDDEYKEDNETFVFALCAGGDDAVHIDDFYAPVYIYDDDIVEVSVLTRSGEVPESRGVAIVAVVVEGHLETYITVHLETGAGSADPFDDFVPVVHDIVFGPDTLDHHIVYIPIVNDDDCVEPIEAFNVHIDSDMDCVDFIIRYATINIVDDDVPEVSLESEIFHVNETGFVYICVELKSYLKVDVTVHLYVIEYTATAYVDFNGTSPLYETFPSGSIPGDRICFHIEIFEDDILEENEIFHVSLSDDGVRVHIQEAIVYIQDDDSACVNFTQSSYRAIEDDEYAEICLELEGEIEDYVTVYLFTIPGTALAGSDFEPLRETITFHESGVICTNVSLIRGDAVEEVEHFSVVLTTLDYRLEIKQYYVQVYIVDRDTVRIGFTQEEYYVDEEDEFGNNGEVEICVTIYGELQRSVTVYVTTRSGTAIAGVDYDDVLQRLTTVEFMFERKKRNAISTDDVQCFNVTILSDIVVEDTEFFYAELSTDDRFVLLNPQHATIHIRSDDRAEVTLDDAVITTGEGDGDVEVCIELIGGILGSDIIVLLNTDEDTAIAPEDFDSQVNTEITLLAGSAPGTRDICAPIPIEPDSKVETSEQFSIRLSSDGPVDIIGSDGVVTIIDDDSVTIAWDESTFLVQEDVGTLTACARITSGTLCRELEVAAETTSSSTSPQATAGVDYVPQMATFVFDDVTSIRCIVVTVNDDSDPEELSEFFAVAMSTTDPAANIPDLDSNVEIQNDDIQFGFQQDDYTVCEGAFFLRVCVDITGGSIDPAVFSISTSDIGTATEGVDYTENEEEFTFNTGDATPCLEIDIEEDTALESCETFGVVLMTSDPNVILSPQSAGVIIYDNEEPTLEYINDTPDINGNVLTGAFLVGGCVSTPQCRFGSTGTPSDCPGSYVLGIPLDVINARQVIINANGFCGNQRTLMREVRSDNTVCHAHQINGVDEEATVVGNTATVMFEGTGPISTNVISDFLIEIQRVQPNGSIMELDVFLCSTAAPSPPYTATCQVDAGGHGEVTVSGFSPSGRFGLLIQPQQPPSGLQCLHLRPRRFEFDI